MALFKTKEILIALLVWLSGAALVLGLVSSCASDQITPVIVDESPIIITPSVDRFESSELNRAWGNESSQIIIDAYRLNTIDWDAMAADKRVTAVIHKSSEGLVVDSKFLERKERALSMGYLWGAYHLGTRDDVKKQADLFLSLIDEKTLIVLDLEDTASSRFMTLSQAVEFLEYIYGKTGRIAVIYANHHTTKLLNQKYPNHELLKKSMLWYARFKSSVTDFPRGVWNGYFLWQFSSEINCARTGACLYNVPGTRYDMDVNVFPGTLSELKKYWYK